MESEGHKLAREIVEAIQGYGIDDVTAIAACEKALDILAQDMAEGDFADALAYLETI